MLQKTSDAKADHNPEYCLRPGKTATTSRKARREKIEIREFLDAMLAQSAGQSQG
jgi:hypothetical protein